MATPRPQSTLMQLQSECQAFLDDEKWSMDEKKWDECLIKVTELNELNTKTNTDKKSAAYLKYHAYYRYYQSVIFINKDHLKKALIACKDARDSYQKIMQDSTGFTQEVDIFYLKLILFHSELSFMGSDFKKEDIKLLPVNYSQALGPQLETHYKRTISSNTALPDIDIEALTTEMLKCFPPSTSDDLNQGVQQAAVVARKEKIDEAVIVLRKSLQALHQQKHLLALVYVRDSEKITPVIAMFSNLILAKVQMELTDYAGALKTLALSITSHPSASAYFMRAEIFYMSEKIEAAKTDYISVMRLENSSTSKLQIISYSPSRQLSRLKFCYVYLEDDAKNDMSAIQFKSIFAHDPSEFQILIKAAHEYIKNNNFIKALPKLKKIVLADSFQSMSNIYYTAVLTKLNAESQEAKEALTIIDWIFHTSRTPDVKKEPCLYAEFLWCKRGYFLFKGNKEESEKYLQKFIDFISVSAKSGHSEMLDVIIQNLRVSVNANIYQHAHIQLCSNLFDPFNFLHLSTRHVQSIKDSCEKLHRKDIEFFDRFGLIKKPHEIKAKTEIRKNNKKRGQGSTRSTVTKKKNSKLEQKRESRSPVEFVYTTPLPSTINLVSHQEEENFDNKKTHAEIREKRKEKRALKETWRREKLANKRTETEIYARSIIRKLIGNAIELKEFQISEYKILDAVPQPQVSNNFVGLGQSAQREEDFTEWKNFVTKHYRPDLGSLTLPPFIKKIQEQLTAEHCVTVFKGGQVTEYLYRRFNPAVFSDLKQSTNDSISATLHAAIFAGIKDNTNELGLRSGLKEASNTRNIVQNLHRQFIDAAAGDEKKELIRRANEIDANSAVVVTAAISHDYDFATGLGTKKIQRAMKAAIKAAGNDYKSVTDAFTGYEAKRATHNNRLCRVWHRNPHKRQYMVDVMHDPDFRVLTPGIDPLVAAVARGNFYFTQAFVVDDKILIPDERTIDDLKARRIRAIKSYENEPVLIFQAVNYEVRYKDSFIDACDVAIIKKLCGSFAAKKDEVSFIMKNMSAGQINSYMQKFCMRGDCLKMILRFSDLGVIWNIPLIGEFYGKQGKVLNTQVTLLKLIAAVDKDPFHGLKKLYGFFILYDVLAKYPEVSEKPSERIKHVLRCIEDNPLYFSVFDKFIQNDSLEYLFTKIYNKYLEVVPVSRNIPMPTTQFRVN